MRIDRPPAFVLILWPFIDGILRRCHHMIPLTGGSGAVFAEVRRNNGHAVRLNDGSEIKAGDTIVELHLNNNWFRERHKLNLTTARLARDILLSFAQDLHVLAKELDTGIFSNAVALHGCTHIGSITGRLGFQVEELPDSLWKRFARFYISGLGQVYGPRRSEASRSSEPIELQEVWFSKRELLRRYGSTHH